MKITESKELKQLVIESKKQVSKLTNFVTVISVFYSIFVLITFIKLPFDLFIDIGAFVSFAIFGFLIIIQIYFSSFNKVTESIYESLDDEIIKEIEHYAILNNAPIDNCLIVNFSMEKIEKNK